MDAQRHDALVNSLQSQIYRLRATLGELNGKLTVHFTDQGTIEICAEYDDVDGKRLRRSIQQISPTQ